METAGFPIRIGDGSWYVLHGKRLDMIRKEQLHQFLVSREFGGAAEIAVRLARHCHEASIGETQVWVPGPGRAADQVRAAGLAMQTYNLSGSYNKSRVWSAINLFWLACRLRRHGKG